MRDTFIGVHAPEFPKGVRWLSGEAFTLGKLRGKVVLIDFWTYSCINCIRTLSYLKKWHKLYKDKGLVIIGVHTPEFDFEKDVENIRRARDKFGIEYRIVVDSDYQVWNAYANKYWPRKLLINQEGVIVYDHAGEGAYGRTEREIQTLLRRDNPDIDLPAVENEKEEFGHMCFPATPETYLGFLRGRVGNPAQDGKENALFKDPGAYEQNKWYLEGEWRIAAEFIEHTRQTEEAEDYLALRFYAAEVNLVMDSDEALEAEILLDKKPLPQDIRGRDVEGKGDTTVVPIRGAFMYQLVSGTQMLTGTLYVRVKHKGFSAYAFTFGGCP